MEDVGHLGPDEQRLYQAVLAQPGAALRELTATLGSEVADADKSAARLADLGLLRVTGAEHRCQAVSPMLAEATVLGAEELELAVRRESVEARREAIRRLVPEWDNALAATRTHEGVEVVSDPTSARNVLLHYAESCRDELLSVAPGRVQRGQVDSRTRVANLFSLRRGIRTRVLYQHSALRDRHTRAYLTELAADGALIRFASSVPGRSLVVDREVAILPIPTGEPGHRGIAIVRDPWVISWIIATFEQLWAEAASLEDMITTPQHNEPELDQTRAAILRLMAEGEKDEAISRRLSISVRTCRRHIADYMVQVGATSRFQAGVIAARSGHAEVPPVG